MKLGEHDRAILFYYTVVGLIVLAVASVGCLLFITALDNQKVESLKKQNAESSRVAQLFVERILSNVEMLAQFAGTSYLKHQGYPDRLQLDLEKLVQSEKTVVQLSVVDLSGRFVASNISAVSGVDLSDREHIKVHLDNPSTRLFISEPLVGRVSQRLTINMTRMLFTTDGEPYSIVVVSVDVQKLGNLLEELAVGSGTVVSVFRHDGILLARSNDDAQQHVGNRFQDLVPLQGGWESSPLSGQYARTSSVDGRMRLYGFHWINNKSLLVFYGTCLGQLTADRQLIGFLAIVALLTLFAGFMGGRFLLYQSFRRRDAAYLALRRDVEVKQAQQLHDATFNAAGVLVVVLGEDGSVRHCNKAAQDILEHLEDKNELPRLLEDLNQSRGDTVKCVGSRMMWKDRQIVINWVVTPADWFSAGAHLAFGFDRSELEALERVLYQRERLSLLGEMSTGLAHEMAQPLSVMNVAAAIIKSDVASDEDRKDAQGRLLLAADRVRRTVDRMKVFARRGPGTVEVGKVSVVSSIKSAIELTRNDLAILGITIVAELPTSEIVCSGGSVAFEQVLLNLIINARDAMKVLPKEAKKEIRITAERSKSGTVIVRVVDTGPGIPPAVASRIFEPFFTTKNDGTGLGLSLSYGIIKEMHGSIRVVERSKGAEFEVELPASSNEDESSPAPNRAVVA